MTTIILPLLLALFSVIYGELVESLTPRICAAEVEPVFQTAEDDIFESDFLTSW